MPEVRQVLLVSMNPLTLLKFLGIRRHKPAPHCFDYRQQLPYDLAPVPVALRTRLFPTWTAWNILFRVEFLISNF